MKHKVSKSAFMLSHQCLKAIHLHYNNAQLKKPLSIDQQAIVDRGTQVGLMARDLLFPGGIDLTQGGKIVMPELLDATKKALSERTSGIYYEAGFASKNLSLRFQADIFVESADGAKIIEVKSSTSIKDEYILDLGFQFFTLRQSGYQKPVECYIAHLNGSYVRQGEITSELFTVENVTQRVLDSQEKIKYHVLQIESTLENPTAPSMAISEYCHKPYQCPFHDFCHKDVPELSVLNIGRLRKRKAYELYNSGFIELSDIPKDIQMSDKQWTEVQSAVNESPFMDHKELKNFLAGLQEPLHFMDFESIQGIAKYEGTGVYQQICFQYCVMTRLKKGGEIIQKDFLADHSIDPRRQFIERLLEDTKESGDIVVYNKLFEIGRLQELANQFPEFKSEIFQRITRIKDLMIPFGKRWFYSHLQKGSHSIKAVLPVLVPSLSYSNLEINNGALASVMYEQIDQYPQQKQKEIRNALLVYCGQDVKAMIEILDALRKITSTKQK
ncbi:MAG: DUF2779 domain-containing protein [Bacteroidota bacterium]